QEPEKDFDNEPSQGKSPTTSDSLLFAADPYFKFGVRLVASITICILHGNLHASPDETSPSSTPISRIPDACSLEEMQILRRLERRNEELMELEQSLRREWLINLSSQPGIREQGLEPRLTTTTLLPLPIRNLGPSEAARASLDRIRAELIARLERLEAVTTYYQRVGWDQCEGGPCHSHRNGIDAVKFAGVALKPHEDS
ncbi:hypothetical protein QAD02_001118, partial [Eretmocerus hayati]